MSPVIRRNTIAVKIGDVEVGGGSPVVIQSMTNTDTADVGATTSQVMALVEAGSELVRITVNNEASAKAVPELVTRLQDMGIRTPIVGDFHYNGHLLLTRFPECAKALAKYRINPGNVGSNRRDDNFRAIIEVAMEHDRAVRIGVNWGSLDQSLLSERMDQNSQMPQPREAEEILRDAMVESAVRSAEFARETGLSADRIILSGKVSSVPELVAVYRQMASQSDYALHLGLTEAGMGAKGIVASTAALAPLLLEGIGDTIRVSLTPQPGGDRTEEVRIARHILQSIGLRHFEPQVTSCPGCGRTTSTFFQEMAEDIQAFIGAQMPVWRDRFPGVEGMDVAVMGCVVNGPGESKRADIGISLPGTAEDPKAPVFVDGEHFTTLQGESLVAEFEKILTGYVEKRYGVE